MDEVSEDADPNLLSYADLALSPIPLSCLKEDDGECGGSPPKRNRYEVE
eukprot:CAMPEP_0198124180 /NCGR_PEP_ID=MMETSP1442-20131203/39350_1 /TAXON_ID= /ORGANISM="Craspedostauros australis, Strain CCMP3328" /LENGTH=48 /DNA_ID= /DNA_START= /DNA_END= /DNA_ORIENTATION=